MLQLSVTALFYLEDSRKIHLWGVRARWSKDTRRRAPQHPGGRERWLWLLCLSVYLSLGLSCVNWASQECCLFYWRSSLWSSDLLLFHLRGLFPSLSVATAILDSSSLLCPPSRPIPRDLYQRGVGRNQRREDTRQLWESPAPEMRGAWNQTLPSLSLQSPCIYLWSANKYREGYFFMVADCILSCNS